MAKPIVVYMPDQGEAGVMQIWYATRKDRQVKWVEVRGKNVRDYDPTDEFHKLHDTKRMDKSQLHADATVTIMEGHPDYEKFAAKLDADA